MKKYNFLLTLFLSSCGLEVPQPIPRLYTPNGVFVENILDPTTLKPISQFRITWEGLNPELEFSGYNIYYTNNFADATSYRGTKILCRQFNPRQATQVVAPPFNVARSFTFDIKKYYYNDGFLFINGTEYWFYITAFNQVRNLESPPSRYVSAVFLDNLP